MKKRERLETTTESKVYKRLKRLRERTGCVICPPHRGCNRTSGGNWGDTRSWKKYRKTQWKINQNKDSDI